MLSSSSYKLILTNSIYLYVAIIRKLYYSSSIPNPYENPVGSNIFTTFVHFPIFYVKIDILLGALHMGLSFTIFDTE